MSETGAGHLVLVVGPSGAGKDTILRGAKSVFAGKRNLVFPRRFVTRLNVPAAEDHVSMTEAEFTTAVSENAFALWWGAHGNHYGIGRSIEGDLAAGAIVCINCSRAAIEETLARFPIVHVVEITAPEAVLVERIMSRGRENADEALQRVSRQVPDYPPGTRLTRIMNDGPPDHAIQAFCSFLQSLEYASADPGGRALDHQHEKENRDDDGCGLVVVEQL